MSLEAPFYLLGFLIVPAAAAAYLLLQRHRERGAKDFANPQLLPNVVDRSPGRLRHLPAVVFLVGLCALLFGVARPHAVVSVKRELATVVLAVDSSRSMAATDVKPSRLEAAKAAARLFVEKVPEKFRIGVVSFASTSRVVSPATQNRAIVRAALRALHPGEGTALGDAIVRGILVARSVPAGSKRTTGEDPPPASILLISDGADMGSDVSPGRAAARARAAGIPIYTVALGTPTGVVEVRQVGGYTIRVQVPPAPDTLRMVARTARGRFFEAPNAEQLKAVYNELGSRLGSRTKREEITFAFAAGGALLMLTGGALSTALFRRLP
jgi:Ca-activated chloride channel family protein